MYAHRSSLKSQVSHIEKSKITKPPLNALRSKLCLELRAKKQAFVGKQNNHCWVLW